MTKRPEVKRGFVEHEISEKTFIGMSLERRELIQRYGIPMVAKSPSNRKFKMTAFWFNKLYPGVMDK